MEDLLQVGVITSTHGIRGEVKVFPTTDDAARLKSLKMSFWIMAKSAGIWKYFCQIFKNQVILKFKGHR